MAPDAVLLLTATWLVAAAVLLQPGHCLVQEPQQRQLQGWAATTLLNTPTRQLMQQAHPLVQAARQAAAAAAGNITARSSTGSWLDRAVAAVNAAAGASNGASIQDYRIVGGTSAPRDRYPYIVSFRDSNDNHFCAGSLITPQVIVSAAHCLSQTDTSLRYPVVDLGRYYRTSQALPYTVSRCRRTIIHPGWDSNTGVNDVSLCVLPSPVNYSTVSVPSAQPPSNAVFTVVGWGATSHDGPLSETLLSVQVPNVPRSSCNSTYDGEITNNMLCAGLPQGGADACQGDSGGPLIIAGNTAADDVLYGIVSFGNGCAMAGVPGVYTDVLSYKDFIDQQLQALGMDPVFPADVNTSTADSNLTSSNSSQLDGTLDPCTCTSDGWSNGTNTGAIGCAQHGLANGDSSYYCYAINGTSCLGATASAVYPGAAWLPCGSGDNPTTVTASSSGSTPLVTAASASSSPVTILMPLLGGGQAPAATTTTGTRPGAIMGGLLQAVLGAMFGGRR